MNIAFWNVERLGASTSDEAKMLVANAVEWFFEKKDVEIFVLCEITSDTTITSDNDLDLIVDKVGHVRRRHKRLDARQLGYSVVFKDDECPYVPSIVEIPNYDEVFDFKSYKKGGCRFKDISKRSVLQLSHLCDSTDVYFYHVNSSQKASFLVAWVAECLRQKVKPHGYPFLLMGDMNCDPNEVRTELMYYDKPALCGPNWSSHFAVRAAGVTHHARKGADKTLDYAVGSAKGAATLSSWDTRVFSQDPGNYSDHPDHFPIMVEVA